MDLPRLLNTTLDTIPDRGNFLAPPPGLTDRWGQRIAAGPHQRIGLTLAGNAAQKNDHNRSIDANFLRPLTEIPNLSLYSLQLGRPGEAVGIFGNAVTDLSPLITDFADTAAAMQHLDLIISVDTSVAPTSPAHSTSPSGHCCVSIPIGAGCWSVTTVLGTRPCGYSGKLRSVIGLA